MQHYTILLNRTGDVALSWDTEDDVEVLTYIQKKMNEGYVFFILENGWKMFALTYLNTQMNNRERESEGPALFRVIYRAYVTAMVPKL